MTCKTYFLTNTEPPHNLSNKKSNCNIAVLVFKKSLVVKKSHAPLFLASVLSVAVFSPSAKLFRRIAPVITQIASVRLFKSMSTYNFPLILNVLYDPKYVHVPQ